MIKCALFGHATIDGRTTWHDGVDYRANCPRCDAPMIQEFQTGFWRLFRETDYNALRDGRPMPRQGISD